MNHPTEAGGCEERAQEDPLAWRGANVVAAPFWLAGFRYLFDAPEGKRYRAVGWMFAIPLALFFVANGRDYYLAPAYPMLLAAGAVGASSGLRHYLQRVLGAYVGPSSEPS